MDMERRFKPSLAARALLTVSLLTASCAVATEDSFSDKSTETPPPAASGELLQAENSRVIPEDKLLSEEKLSELGVTVYDFSHFPGRIELTESFAQLIEPFTNRSGNLRVIWVDSPVTAPEYKTFVEKHGYLSFISNEGLARFGDEINKVRADDIARNVNRAHSSEVLQTSTDKGAFTEFNFVNSPTRQSEKSLIATIVVGVSNPYLGYTNPADNYFRTYPSNHYSVLGMLLNEISSVRDFAGYLGFDDPRYLNDYDASATNFESRPGEVRSDRYVQTQIYRIIAEGDLMPPVAIYDEAGNLR